MTLNKKAFNKAAPLAQCKLFCYKEIENFLIDKDITGCGAYTAPFL